MRDLYAFNNYLREFTSNAGWLQKRQRISKRDILKLLWRGIPKTPFEREDIVEAAEHVLNPKRFDYEDKEAIRRSKRSQSNRTIADTSSSESESDSESEAETEKRNKKKRTKHSPKNSERSKRSKKLAVLSTSESGDLTESDLDDTREK